MESAIRDVWVAVRALKRAPAFTITAILMLAAGIFVVASTFAVTNVYLVRALPFPAAKRLVRVVYGQEGQQEPIGMQNIDWRGLGDIVEWADVGNGRRLSLVEGAQATDIMGLGIAPNGFEPLGLRLSAGRTFTPDEYRRGADNVVIVGAPLLRGRPFSTEPPMYLNLAIPNSGDAATPYRIVGVLTPNTRFARDYGRGEIEFVIPQATPSSAYLVRLREGVRIDVAARRLTETIRRMTPAPPADWKGIHMISVQDMYVSQIRPILVAVTAAAGLILLIVAANVAVLVVLRALRRERDVAVRVALGASAREIARMLGAEAVLLCAGAVVLGTGLTAMALGALGPVIESRLGRPVPGGVSALGVDSTVLLVVGAGALAATLLLVFAPMAIPVARRFERSLRAGARAGSDGPGVRRARFALVALQVAASLALLFGGGLIVRSVRNLMNTNFGYNTAELVRVQLRFPNRQFPDSASIGRVQRALEDAARERTGAPIAFTTLFPFWEASKLRVDLGPGAEQKERRVAMYAVGPQYFDVAGIPLRAGRAFDARDGLEAARVAIVSETLARQLWPGEDAIGKQMRTEALTFGDTVPTVWRTVVGVVSDVRETHRDADFSGLYLPAAQMGVRFGSVIGTPGAQMRRWHETVRAVALELNPAIFVGPPIPLSDGYRQTLEAPRFLMSALTGLALLAVAIALVGIYGVTAYAVEQRTREIAVRSAIGATPRDLVGLFLREGGRVVAVGVAIGLLGALWIGRLLQNQVFGVVTFDAVTLLGAMAVIAIGCTIAAWLPARKAAMLDTAAVLRAD